MRRLLLVPIIHSQEDMGSTGPALAERSAALVEERRWQLHGETMHRFWENVRACLSSLDPRQLRVYQDGLPTGGEPGRRIVARAAEQGSENYRLILELLNAGAHLRPTEDPALLLQEHQTVSGLMRRGAAQSGPGSGTSPEQRDSLMESRDRSIARAIDATLGPGEVGVLFIGAYHRVESYLAKDIAVEAIKDPQQVREYFKELFLDRPPEAGRLAELTRYLGSPVTVAHTGPNKGPTPSR
ncbi:MAG: hypothetical protein AAB270_03700 [Chloroflexota bacterium]